MRHESYAFITEREISYKLSPATSLSVMRCLVNVMPMLVDERQNGRCPRLPIFSLALESACHKIYKTAKQAETLSVFCATFVLLHHRLVRFTRAQAIMEGSVILSTMLRTRGLARNSEAQEILTWFEVSSYE